MEVALLSAPAGFASACRSFAAAETKGGAEVLSTLVHSAHAVIVREAVAVDADAISQELRGTGVHASVQAVQEWSTALAFVYRAVQSHSPSAAELQELLVSATELSAGAAELVCRPLSRQAGGAGEQAGVAQLSMSIGRLAGAEWSVGASVASGMGADTAAGDLPLQPFVNLQLRVSTVEGGVKHTPLQLTLGEFNELHQQLKDMAQAMDGV